MAKNPTTIVDTETILRRNAMVTIISRDRRAAARKRMKSDDLWSVAITNIDSVFRRT